MTTTEELSQKIDAWLAHGRPWREALPGGGTLHFDRPLPYLFIYRRPTEGTDDLTAELVRTEAAYLISDREHDDEVRAWVKALVQALSDRYQAFLLVEVWADDDLSHTFELHGPEKIHATIETLSRALHEVSLPQHKVTVGNCAHTDRCAPGRKPLLDREERKTRACLALGLALRPFYRDAATGETYPDLLRYLRRTLSRAFRRTVFDFVRVQTNQKPVHFHTLGPRTLTDEVRDVDRALTEVGQAFEFLLLVSPVNLREAWRKFHTGHYRKPPTFHYRLLPVDPDTLKRRLYQIPIERVEDPTLADMFRDKRRELERMLTLLADRDTPNFRYGSLQLFGGVDEPLRNTAKGLMSALKHHRPHRDARKLTATEFQARAQAEIDYLAAQTEGMQARAILRDDVSGLMVSEGQFYISANYVVPEHRAEALIQHEVGTHVLTYYNGRAQPLHLLYSGVPGYEELQEGLAVLSEYLVGGLTARRLRKLAARVIAVDMLLDDAPFAETFRTLRETYGFKPFTAFQVTARVYRGGGLTKDAVYLKGLVDLLDYLRAGHPLEPLLIGKIREDYLDIVSELIHRRVLHKAPIRPRYLDLPEAQTRLKQLKQPGKTVFNLIEL
ncbi:MAG: tyrosine/phenylalanine carboxypeptidase domain-containing protein [Catalinimonas sp.]